jgi:hypothetical protein
LQGDVAAYFAVEASSDLKTWTPVNTVYSSDGAISIQDNVAGGASVRFYRATQLPN